LRSRFAWQDFFIHFGLHPVLATHHAPARLKNAPGTTKTKERNMLSNTKTIILVSVIVVVIAGAGASIAYFTQTNETPNSPNAPMPDSMMRESKEEAYERCTMTYGGAYSKEERAIFCAYAKCNDGDRQCLYDACMNLVTLYGKLDEEHQAKFGMNSSFHNGVGEKGQRKCQERHGNS
jgi:predicted ribosomally synthesized peptide with SipW-like signal peptide